MLALAWVEAHLIPTCQYGALQKAAESNEKHGEERKRGDGAEETGCAGGPGEGFPCR